MQTKLETIGPKEAQRLLEIRSENRPVRRGWVKFIAEEMKRGQWQSTHQGIAVDTDGKLIDGQHRMLAVIESGATVQMLVSRGLNKDEAYRAIDSGLARTIGDRLKLLSDPNKNQIACRIVRAYLTATGQIRGRASVDVVEDCFLSMSDEFSDIAEAFNRKISGLTRADVGAAIVSYASKHKAKAYLFAEQLISGEGLTQGDPALLLREALFMRRIGWHDIYDGYWKTINATKAHFKGEKMRGISLASEDWRGNKYTRLVHERARRSEKGSRTKTVKKIQSKLASELERRMLQNGAVGTVVPRTQSQILAKSKPGQR